MKKVVVFDIECDGLDATVIHCVCVKELGERNLNRTYTNAEEFNAYAKTVDQWIGHNCIDYDIPILNALWLSGIDMARARDTLVMSRLVDAAIEGGHSLEAWGKRLGIEKVDHNDWSVYSKEMELRCKTDVEITYKLFCSLLPALERQLKALELEHEVAILCRDMHENGFKFNVIKAKELMEELNSSIAELDVKIQEAFPPEILEIQLKTKVKIVTKVFNPNSAKQIIERIHAYWKPTEKTKGHLEAERTGKKLEHYKKFGWKLSEHNFGTLFEEAPEAAKLLIKRLLLETRRRKLKEWFECLGEEGRIHGRFTHIGTWTHRMVHTNPNQANVATEKSIKYRTEELSKLATRLGRRMRELFICEEEAWLVGVDAAGIQLRVLAHYLNEPEFTRSLVLGKKEDGTDIHSKNVQTLGVQGINRDNAKTFIYAWILGAGLPKVASILDTDLETAKKARERFEDSYAGVGKLRTHRIETDARRGYFVGLDNRRVLCSDSHRMLAAYLQCGEAVIMKSALVSAVKKLRCTAFKFKLINFVHDELLFEITGSYEDAVKVKEIVEEEIEAAGRRLTPNVPQKGEGAVGKNWLAVH